MFKMVFTLVLMTYLSVISQSKAETKTSVIISSSNIVSNNVYKILGGNIYENVLYCPVSTNILLTLVSTASKGITAKELKTFLHLNIEDKDIKSGYKILLKELQDKELHLATRIFPKTGKKLVPEFATTARTYFDSDVQAVDYSNSSNAANIINTFVAKKTNNKILDLINAESIDSNTQLLLVNAAHFKDKWLYSFERSYTGDFYLRKDKRVKTKLIMTTKFFNYKHSTALDAKVLQMKFKSSSYSFVILLPNKIDGLHEMETKLASSNIDEIMNNLRYKSVKVTIPKFKMESSINLKTVCEKLGVKTLFQSPGNLNGFVKDNSLYVSKILQKNMINVDETGAEAAAATGLMAHSISKRPSPEEFRADHPFVFFIMRKNMIIFQGRLSKM